MTDIGYAVQACRSHFSISIVNFLKAKSNVSFLPLAEGSYKELEYSKYQLMTTIPFSLVLLNFLI